MTKNEIIEKWWKEGVIQKTVKHYKGIDWNEVISVVVADLCEKDEVLIQQLHDSGDYKYYIARMVANQIKSYNSPFRWQNRFSGLTSPIDTYLDTFTNKSVPKALKTLEERLTGEDLIILDMVVNYSYSKGDRLRPQAEIMERYGCTRYTAWKIFDEWKEKVKQLLN